MRSPGGSFRQNSRHDFPSLNAPVTTRPRTRLSADVSICRNTTSSSTMTVRMGTLVRNLTTKGRGASATLPNGVVLPPPAAQHGVVNSLALLAPLFLLFEIWQLVMSERYVGIKQIAR